MQKYTNEAVLKRFGAFMILYFYEELKRYSGVRSEWTKVRWRNHRTEWPELRRFAAEGIREIFNSFSLADPAFVERFISAASGVCLIIDEELSHAAVVGYSIPRGLQGQLFEFHEQLSIMVEALIKRHLNPNFDRKAAIRARELAAAEQEKALQRLRGRVQRLKEAA